MSAPADRMLVLNAREDGPARDAHTRLLRQAGFDVVEAATGAETLRRAVATQPHVVLLDVRLVDLDGDEVCGRLKAHPATAGIPVLLLSADGRADAEHLPGVDAGADGVLLEPVAPEVLFATVRSVARARGAQDAMRAVARLWQLTFDAITDAVCLLDPDGQLLRHNAVFARLAGEGRESAGDDGIAIVGTVLRQPAAELRPLLAPERRVVREFLVGGRWLQLVSEAVRDEIGTLEGTLIVLTDISERKWVDTMKAELLRMEQEARLAAEASNRAKDEFLAVLSHELRTPLTAVLGWIRMLAVGDLDRAASAHAVEVIERNTRLQAQIVEDLLDVSRIVSGKMILEIGDVTPSAVLEPAADGVRAAAEAKRIQLDLAVAPALGSVRGDAGRLQQVLSNLLSNAVKFTPPGGQVRVTAEREGNELRVAVADTGRGIDPALLPHVFEPFRQAEGASRRTHTGLGLGLAIVRHLVELHGGRVQAASPGLDAGATFTVWLPLVLPVTREPEVPAASGGQARRASLHGVRLLIVEDDADTREVIGLMLRESGAEVTGVASAAAALETIDRAAPDVLIGDIGLSDGDGCDLIRAVRRLPGARGGVPAIALSVFARESDRLDAIRAGYDRYLSKPVEPRALRSAVFDLLATRRR
jgi:signal transduction histidine kinase